MKKQVTEQVNIMNEMKESFVSLAHIRTDGELR